VDWRGSIIAEGRVGLAHLDADTRDELNRVWHRLTPWPDTVAGGPTR